MKNQSINYKGVQVKQELVPYFKHMELVDEYREELVSLSKSWDNLSLLSHFGNNSTNINETKNNFSDLTSRLLNHLSNELLQKTIRQMKFKAQISIDILIRNLFERTADIGFLSTDNDIREFIKNNKNRYDQGFQDNVKILRNRFLEYTQKYSVYYDIILMDTKGKVLVQLDNNDQIDKSNDEIISLSLNSKDYIESFKYHDFLPSKKRSLVYASKITENDDENSESIGVLCLCFRFKDEMKGIFDNLKDEKNKECLTILDKEGTVIASSDSYHIGLGSHLEFDINSKFNLVSHGGRDYLAKSCKTNGYQGYMGQEWYGHIMIPLEHSFIIEDDNLEIDEKILLAILQEGEDFSEDLKSIPLQANSIQTNLNRLVWNGNINKNEDRGEKLRSFSRALLNEISLTGEKTRKIFDISIANLTKTIILNNATYIASLMVDIMDRNLYERANDCRWWALTQDFKDILSSNSIDKTNNPKLTQILKYINNLYTVYTNLFIYDNNGIIVSVSNEEENHLIGMQLNDEVIQNTKKIKNSNDYFVSDFERTKLYNDDFTYTYYASITHNDFCCGGIGVVFDSKVEFKAMLEESIPNYIKENDKNKRFGVFTNKKGVIISSTNDKLKVGDALDIDKKFFNLINGESKSEIIVYDGNYYAIGIKCSNGYREFKKSDDYKNDVYAVFFSYISSASLKISNNKEIFKENSNLSSENTQEIGSFYIGGKWLGVEIEKLIEVVSVDKLDLSPTLNDKHHFKGTIIYDNKAVGVIDIQNFLDEEVKEEYKEVVIIKHFDETSENYVGILINELGDIPEVPKSRIKELDNYLLGNCTLVNSVVVPDDTDKETKILSLLDIGMLKNNLVE